MPRAFRLLLTILLAASAPLQAGVHVAAPAAPAVPMAPGAGVVAASVVLTQPGNPVALTLNVPFTLTPSAPGLQTPLTLTPQSLSLSADGAQVWQGDNARIGLALPDSQAYHGPVAMSELTNPAHSEFQAEVFRQIEPQLRQAGVDPTHVRFSEPFLGAAKGDPVCLGCDEIRKLLDLKTGPDAFPSASAPGALDRLFDGMLSQQKRTLEALGMDDRAAKLDEVSARIVRTTGLLRDPDVPAPIRRWLMNPSVMATLVGAKPTTRNFIKTVDRDTEMDLLATPEGVAQIDEAVKRISPKLGVIESKDELVVYDIDAAAGVLNDDDNNKHFKLRDALPAGDAQAAVKAGLELMLTGGLFSGYRAHEGLLFGFPLSAVLEFAAKGPRPAALHMMEIFGEYELDQIAWGTRSPLAQVAGQDVAGRARQEPPAFEASDNLKTTVWYDSVLRLAMHFLKKMLLGGTPASPLPAPAIDGIVRPDYSPVKGSPDVAVLDRARAHFEAIRSPLNEFAPETYRGMNAVAEALRAADWDSPVFIDAERAVHLALMAHRRGNKYDWMPQVTLAQFATVVLRWETARQFGLTGEALRPVALLADGTLTAEALRLFGKGGLRYLGDIEAPGQLARLEAELKALPESERFVFVAEGTAPQIAKTSLAIYDPASKDAVTPSIGVIQAAMRAKHGDDAVGLQLAFGRAESEDLPEGLARGGRVFGLGYPGVWEPSTFHEVLNGVWLYSMHDIYHLMWGARLPPTARQAAVRVYELALKLEGGGGYVELDGKERPVAFPSENWDFFSSAVIDTDLDMRPDHIAASLDDWFGALEKPDGKLSMSALVLMDMGRNPELWRGMGVTPETADAVAASQGAAGTKILAAARSGR
ncbi:MAG: hypothetical protein HYZ75_08610 [Elusimicrobia bacterium]|nr:hypothetical protein [Elusimicrobiota bacterium]